MCHYPGVHEGQLAGKRFIFCDWFSLWYMYHCDILFLRIVPSNTPSPLCCLRKDSTGRRRLLCTSKLKTGKFQQPFLAALILDKYRGNCRERSVYICPVKFTSRKKERSHRLTHTQFQLTAD